MSYEFQISGEQAALYMKSLEKKFTAGVEERDALVKQVADLHISDKLVSPWAMSFCGGATALEYNGATGGEALRVSIHSHALSQLCSMAMFRREQINIYTGFNAPWARDLIDHNLNELFHRRTFLDKKKEPARFLHRLVPTRNGLQLRGFLSRSFGRHLASKPLLRGFTEACNNVGARPIEASTSDVFFSLKCFLPIIFEPVPNEFVAFGVTWSNSDFGRGSLTVAFSLIRINTGGSIILGDSMSRRHIGSIIKDTDLEISEDTARKEVDAQISAINDCVQQDLSHESVNRMCAALAEASEKKISWSRIKAELPAIGKSELTTLQEYFDKSQAGVIDLPPLDFGTADSPAEPSRWWVSNAISLMAKDVTDPDRKADLQQAAGLVLKK